MTTIYYVKDKLISITSAWIIHLRCGNDAKYKEFTLDFKPSEEVYFLFVGDFDIGLLINDPNIIKITIFTDTGCSDSNGKVIIKKCNCSEIFEELQLTTYQANIQKLLKYIDDNHNRITYTDTDIHKFFDILDKIVDTDLSNDYIFKYAVSCFQINNQNIDNDSSSDNFSKFLISVILMITILIFQ